MEIIVIEKGIPMPSAKMGFDKFRLKEMEVGDSFYVECSKEEDRKIRNTISLRAARVGIGISIRRIDKGIRIWRTE